MGMKRKAKKQSFERAVGGFRMSYTDDDGVSHDMTKAYYLRESNPTEDAINDVFVEAFEEAQTTFDAAVAKAKVEGTPAPVATPITATFIGTYFPMSDEAAVVSIAKKKVA